MPKLNFTATELKDYFKHRVRHFFYQETVEHAMKMKIHSNGDFPEKLIYERRPNEPLEVLEYRRMIYVPKSKPSFDKVLSSLNKIRRSSDWAILHKESEKFSRVAKGETLEEYCELNFPYHASVTNWIFGVLLKAYADDPNAIIVEKPIEWQVESNTYLRPFPSIFSSEYVIDYVPEDYVVLINPKGCTYYIRGVPQKGQSYYTITTQEVVRYDQINSKGDLVPRVEGIIPFGELPAWRIGAIVEKTSDSNYLYKSRLSPMLVELDEAVREYSDLQAAKVNHIFPERYEYTNKECIDCKGVGQRQEVINGDPCIVPCKTCGGQGVMTISTGPYDKMIIKANNNIAAGENNYPPPPGYIAKDTEIVKIQDEGVDKHIYNALSSINFQFLEQTPLNQSGTAKEVDKDELNNTVHAIAEDLVRNMDLVYRYAALWRYHVQYRVDDILEFMLPSINVPEKYDILSSDHLLKEMADTKDLNPIIRTALQIDYASKKFIANPEVKDRLTLIFELDPLPNISEDDKMSRLSNKGITLLTYVISSNIQAFVQRALDEDEKFADLALDKQKEKIKAFAEEEIAANDTSKDIVKDVNQESGLNPDGTPIEDFNKVDQVKEPVAA